MPTNPYAALSQLSGLVKVATLNREQRRIAAVNSHIYRLISITELSFKLYCGDSFMHMELQLFLKWFQQLRNIGMSRMLLPDQITWPDNATTPAFTSFSDVLEEFFLSGGRLRIPAFKSNQFH